jgi:hypothetical protein
MIEEPIPVSRGAEVSRRSDLDQKERHRRNHGSGQRCVQGLSSTPVLTFGEFSTHAALFLSICMELVSEYASKAHLPCATHVVEDMDDNEDGHASVELGGSLFSSFFRASRPPNSASGSRVAAESPLGWSHFISLGSSEDIVLAGQSAGGTRRETEKRLRLQVLLAGNL